MVSAKIMWNSVISTPGAKFGGADIKNMYLKTPLDGYKYMQMPLKLFPDDIIKHYNLQENYSMATFTWRSDVACMGYHKPTS
jgi:hypothetical protein